MTNLKTFNAPFLKTSISDLTHCCTEPFNYMSSQAIIIYFFLEMFISIYMYLLSALVIFITLIYHSFSNVKRIEHYGSSEYSPYKNQLLL